MSSSHHNPPMPVNSTRVELTIDELVLYGFGSASRDAIAEAVRGELTSLLMSESVAPARDIAIEHVDALQAELAPGAQAETIGAAIGRAIYGGLPR